MTEFAEVTRDEFFAYVGPRDVHPSLTGNWPYTCLWKGQFGGVFAKSVDYIPEGKALTETKWFLPVGVKR